jgi:hypothetical protein
LWKRIRDIKAWYGSRAGQAQEWNLGFRVENSSNDDKYDSFDERKRVFEKASPRWLEKVLMGNRLD